MHILNLILVIFGLIFSSSVQAQDVSECIKEAKSEAEYYGYVYLRLVAFSKYTEVKLDPVLKEKKLHITLKNIDGLSLKLFAFTEYVKNENQLSCEVDRIELQ